MPRCSFTSFAGNIALHHNSIQAQMKRLIVAIFTLAVPLIACTPREPGVSDSAGVAVIEVPPIATAAPFIDTVPLVDIGGEANQQQIDFSSAGGFPGAVMLSNGDFVAKDEYRVRYFDAAGKQRAVVGTKGSGPNEFRLLTAICATHGDTIVAFDAGNERTSILDRDGHIIQSYATTAAGQPMMFGCFSDGTYLTAAYQLGPKGEQRQKLGRMRLNGEVVNELATVSNGNHEVNPGLNVSVFAVDTTFIVADPEIDEVRRFSREGKLLSVLKMSDSRSRTVDPSRLPQVGMITEGEGGEIKQAAPPERKTGRWPIFQGALLDEDGSLWIETREHSDTSLAVWSNYEWTGKVREIISLPGTLQVLQGHPLRYPPTALQITKRGVFLTRDDSDGALHYTLFRRTQK